MNTDGSTELAEERSPGKTSRTTGKTGSAFAPLHQCLRGHIASERELPWRVTIQLQAVREIANWLRSKEIFGLSKFSG